jgi:hypothetical protein
MLIASPDTPGSHDQLGYSAAPRTTLYSIGDAMLLDVAETIQKFVNSPPGQLLAGGVIAGLVWKCFERVEVVLTDDTKLEIAVWLVGAKPLGPKMEPWPDTIIRLFDVVFGRKHLSLQCFLRSFMVSFVLSVAIWIHDIVRDGYVAKVRSVWYVTYIISAIVLASALPDYASLCKTRWTLTRMARTKVRSVRWGVILMDAALTAMISMCGLVLITLFLSVVLLRKAVVLSDVADMVTFYWFEIVDGVPNIAVNTFYAAFVSSLWIWLYAGAGFLLKAARRFDIGFQWFNRHFDIEKKPLQSIGLVSGVLVAFVYWAVVGGLFLAQH